MGNIIDYIEWRGDITFAEQEFNGIDSLVFAMLSYIDFMDVLVEDAENNVTNSIGAIYKRYLNIRNDVPKLLGVMAKSKRFCNCRLFDYIQILDHEVELTQFSAIHIYLNNKYNQEYVAFRGTDNSITGWQEDFSISFQVVAAQKYAEDFLRKVLEHAEGKVFVGGHSKGGNLAIFAASKMKEALFDKIVQIHNFDGPGLCPDVLKEEDYQKIAKKQLRVVPDFYLIGSLFEREEPDYVVKSSVDNLGAHNAYTWQIKSQSFQTAKVKKKAVSYQQVFGDWIETVDLEQREIFVRDFFGSLKVNGAVTVEQISEGGISTFEDIFLSFGKSKKESKIVFGKLIISFIRGISRGDILEVLHTKHGLKSVGTMIIGLICVCFPSIASSMIGTAFFIWLLLYSSFYLYKFYRSYLAKEKVVKGKVLFYSAITGIELLCIIKNNIIQVSVKLILGGFFLFHAWKSMRTMILRKSCQNKKWILSFVDMIVTGMFGIVSIATSNLNTWMFVLAAGSYLLMYGLAQTVQVMYEQQYLNEY